MGSDSSNPLQGVGKALGGDTPVGNLFSGGLSGTLSQDSVGGMFSNAGEGSGLFGSNSPLGWIGSQLSGPKKPPDPSVPPPAPGLAAATQHGLNTQLDEEGKMYSASTILTGGGGRGLASGPMTASQILGPK